MLDPSGLQRVLPEHRLIRLVHPDDWDDDAKPGQIALHEKAMTKGEMKATTSNTGPSSFDANLLIVDPGESAEAAYRALLAAFPAWAAHRAVCTSVSSLEAIEGVCAYLTPDECNNEKVRHAHASLWGVTRGNRPDVFRAFWNGELFLP